MIDDDDNNNNADDDKICEENGIHITVYMCTLIVCYAVIILTSKITT
jgi:hypothetical protein